MPPPAPGAAELRSWSVRLLLLGPLAVAVSCAGGSPAVGTSDIVAQIPFADGERLVYALYDNAGEVVARGTLTTRREGDGLTLEQAYEEVGTPEGVEPTSDTITVAVYPGTMKPLSGFRLVMRRDRDGAVSAEEHEWRYVPGEERDVVVATRRRDDETEQWELRLREHHYDNESSLWLWRTIELAEDYEARYVSVNHFERSQQTVSLRVVDRQTIEVPAGEFDTWRLQLRSGRATRVAWINVEAPHQVVQWDNGSVVFRLEEIGELAEQ